MARPTRTDRRRPISPPAGKIILRTWESRFLASEACRRFGAGLLAAQRRPGGHRLLAKFCGRRSRTLVSAAASQKSASPSRRRRRPTEHRFPLRARTLQAKTRSMPVWLARRGGDARTVRGGAAERSASAPMQTAADRSPGVEALRTAAARFRAPDGFRHCDAQRKQPAATRRCSRGPSFERPTVFAAAPPGDGGGGGSSRRRRGRADALAVEVEARPAPIRRRPRRPEKKERLEKKWAS